MNAATTEKATPPSGFFLAMPPAWKRIEVTPEGFAALHAEIRAQCRSAGRPDLEAEAVTLLRAQWSAMQRRGVKQLFHDSSFDPETKEVRPPASISVTPVASLMPESFRGTVERRFGATFEEKPHEIGTILVHSEVAEHDGDMAGMRSYSRLYVVQQPAPVAERGLAFLASVLVREDQVAEARREYDLLFDAILAGFRWRP